MKSLYFVHELIATCVFGRFFAANGLQHFGFALEKIVIVTTRRFPSCLTKPYWICSFFGCVQNLFELVEQAGAQPENHKVHHWGARKPKRYQEADSPEHHKGYQRGAPPEDHNKGYHGVCPKTVRGIGEVPRPKTIKGIRWVAKNNKEHQTDARRPSRVSGGCPKTIKGIRGMPRPTTIRCNPQSQWF